MGTVAGFAFRARAAATPGCDRSITETDWVFERSFPLGGGAQSGPTADRTNQRFEKRSLHRPNSAESNRTGD